MRVTTAIAILYGLNAGFRTRTVMYTDRVSLVPYEFPFAMMNAHFYRKYYNSARKQSTRTVLLLVCVVRQYKFAHRTGGYSANAKLHWMRRVLWCESFRALWTRPLPHSNFLPKLKQMCSFTSSRHVLILLCACIIKRSYSSENYSYLYLTLLNYYSTCER